MAWLYWIVSGAAAVLTIWFIVVYFVVWIITTPPGDK